MRYFRRPDPKIKCDLEWSADFGYGPTEHHPCTNPATHRARQVFMDFRRPWDQAIPTPEKILLCEAHAKDWNADPDVSTPYCRSITPAYRFRRV